MAAQTQRTARGAKAKSAKTRTGATTKAKRASRKVSPQGRLASASSGLLSQLDVLGVKPAARLAAVSAAVGAVVGASVRPVIKKISKVL